MNYTTAMPDLVRLLFRLPVDLHAELVEWAKEENRSLTAQMIYLLTQAVKKRKGA